MEYDLSILTEKQRQAWELRQKGLSYRKIGEKMGISTNAATTHVHNAERRFRQWEKYNAIEQQNNEIVPVELTRGEVKLLVLALHTEQQRMQKDAHYNIHTDWKGRLPYESRIISGLSEKLQLAVYQQVILPPLLTSLTKEETESAPTDNIVPFPTGSTPKE